MDISVVIPLYNEAESLPELHAWIKRVMDEHHYSYEIYFVNDGSTDDSWKRIIEWHSKNRENIHKSSLILRKENGGAVSFRNFLYRRHSLF